MTLEIRCGTKCNDGKVILYFEYKIRCLFRLTKFETKTQFVHRETTKIFLLCELD